MKLKPLSRKERKTLRRFVKYTRNPVDSYLWNEISLFIKASGKKPKREKYESFIFENLSHTITGHFYPECETLISINNMPIMEARGRLDKYLKDIGL